MNVRIGIAGAAFLLFSLSCGSSPGPSLVISPGSLTITSGSTAAGFTATETGATNTIAWSLAGPGTISATSGPTTSYTPPAGLAASTTATLTATAGTLTANATITINPPALNLTVAPQSLTIPAGRSSTLFTATETGASNPITWTLTGPGTLSTLSGATTNYSPPLGVSAQTTATLQATAGALTALPVTITITVPTPVTVTGTVVAMNNVPMSGVSVTIAGHSILTGADGTFTLANVTPAYDLIAIAGKIAMVYQQLTVPSPTIVFFNPNASLPTVPNSGTVTGLISPSSLLSVAGYETIVAWGSPQTSIYAVNTSPNANPFSLSSFLEWVGPTSITGNVHVIQAAVDNTTFYPTSYSGYGTSQNVVVTNGGMADAGTINLTSTAVGTLVAPLTLPSSYSLLITIMNLEFSDGATALVEAQFSSTWPATFATPLNINATIDLAALAEDTTLNVFSGSYTIGIPASAADAGVAVLVGSTFGLPSDTASGITTTSNFTWTPFAGGVNVVVFTPSNVLNPTYVVFTGATSITIPDLSTEGLGLPVGSQGYTWGIYGFAPFANLDVFAGENFIAPLAQDGILVLKPPSSLPVYNYSLTAHTRSFTTQ
jgi:hypothetical protein